MLPCYKDTSYRMKALLTLSETNAWSFMTVIQNTLLLQVKELSHIRGCSQARNYHFKGKKMTLDLGHFSNHSLRTPILPMKTLNAFPVQYGESWDTWESTTETRELKKKKNPKL